MPFSRRGKCVCAASLLALATLAPATSRAVTVSDGGRGTFSDPTRIDNRWFPLTPGTQFTYEGQANRGEGQRRHRVVFTVTDLVKVVDGVRTVLLWDRDYNAGVLQENEITFHAQDDEGTVWNFGEYPEEYEDGFFLGAPNTWITGLADAEPGIHMLDQRDVGVTYLQGFAPEIDFLDCAEVVAEGLQECDIPAAPGGCFENGVLTHERSPLDPGGAIQTKYHAPDVGIAKVGALNDPEGETLVLRQVVALDQAQMAAVRGEALKLDQRGFRVSEVYCQTEPIEPTPTTECPAPIVPAPGGTTSPGSTQTSGGTLAPSTPAPAAPKRRSRRKSCYAKRSRPSARRKAPRVVTPSGSRVLVKKMRRKTCAELLSRR